MPCSHCLEPHAIPTPSIRMTQFESFLAQLRDRYRALFGTHGPDYGAELTAIALPILARLAEGNAPYHTVSHTQQVMEVGQAIVEGKQRVEGSLSALDWLHYQVSLLCHDVGYLRGICVGDQVARDRYSDGQGNWVDLPATATDAALGPQHVDRGKAFVAEQFRTHPHLSARRLQRNLEMTRFPVPNEPGYHDTWHLPGICRGADLLGQLSDPHYLRRLPTLFQEFEETGMAAQMGYRTAADLRSSYPQFYWHVVYPLVRDSLHYLSVTAAGRKAIARLYTNLYLVEMEQRWADTTSATLRDAVATAQLIPWQAEDRDRLGVDSSDT